MEFLFGANYKENSPISKKENMEKVTADFRREGDLAFQEETGNDNPASSPEVEVEKETDIEQPEPSNQDKEVDVDKEPVDDKDKPDRGLADHPRWIERENDWKERFNKQEERHLSELAKLREEVETKLEGVKSDDNKNVSQPIPTWFGGDEEQYKSFVRDLDSRIATAKEEARQETLKELDTKSSSEKKAIEEAKQYFQSQVDEIEEKEGVKLGEDKLHKLVKIVWEKDLLDSKSRYNFKAGWEILKAKSSQPVKKENKERKEIAGVTTSNQRAEEKIKNYATSKDFKGKSWDDMKKWV